MTLLELIFISIGLGMDACSVSISKGICMSKYSIYKGIIIGLWFATFQLIMPLIGYYFGNIFGSNIKVYSHLIACILLVLLGINMIISKEDINVDDDISVGSMILPSIATSIDALSIGITFSLLDNNIYTSVIVIFIITFILSLLGTKVGNIFNKHSNKSQLIGGIILIVMGINMII